MLVKKAFASPGFIAPDLSFIREVLHPANDPIGPGLSLALAEVAPGRSTAPHRLAVTEIYYILSGRGLMTVEGETRELEPHDAVRIPAKHAQSIACLGEETLRFLCICHPAYDPAGDERA